ncbi:Hsp20/alpha crystallin family protein [Marinobacter nanhaiticus D15-8W]|uniref:Hsp20/alpha crystallin family protein n=1 Tax=Marinobacter nanhaiticus D15-8W TaxID=626887 RepID=N6WUU6_9GAMM|nr:Hsp20/alpha crystallin family protein [Marinobacter nanhaiticus]ENO14772.1 Hsp20/alpha crystallin family protein [Marinobacter nanhaiticus D15-8W]BES69539.1 Hsp20/alpha crystallin family protein [Marinobacter nanhaiticus D15-8W]
MSSLIPHRGSVLASFQDEINRLFGDRGLGWPFEEGEASGLAANWTPAVDIKEEEKEYIVRADLPGVDPKQIEVSLESGVLTIKGERQDEKKTEENGFHRVERFSGSFFRRIALPKSTDEDQVKARAVNGVLEIHVPKAEAKGAKRIEVEA